MDPVKDAFSKVKQDMDSLASEIMSIKETLDQTREELVRICEVILSLDKKVTKINENSQNQVPAHSAQNQTIQTDTQTGPAHNSPFSALKGQNMVFSNGNRGVPTDRQTNQQTDNLPQNEHIYNEKPFQEENPRGFYTSQREVYSPYPLYPPSNTTLPSQFPSQTPLPPVFQEKTSNSIDNAARILDSLDGIKKEIRLKFKRLTTQEMAVFSTIYQLEEEGIELDYKALSLKLGLTESSVRDYVGKLIKKEFPSRKRR